MDAFGAEHMRKWIDYQFEREDTETRDQLQADMAERFEQDPEFRGGQSYWTLYHAVMEERAREARTR